MKTRVKQQELARALASVKGLMTKDALSVFHRIRLDVAGPNVSVTAADGTVQLERRFSGITMEDGTATLPRIFARFAGAMPGGVTELESAGEEKVRMSSGNVSFTMSAGDATVFARMQGPSEGPSATVPSMTLREMLRKVRHSVCMDETRGALCGVNMKLAGGTLGMTATDGRRLAHVEHKLDSEAEFDITLPAKAAGMLWSLLDDDNLDDVAIRADRGAVRIAAAGWCLTATVVVRAYPSWRQIVPEKLPHAATVPRAALLEALGRVALAADADGAVTVELKDGYVALCGRSESAEARAKVIGCRIADRACAKFMFNPTLLVDALQCLEEDDVTVGFDDACGPVKITCSIPWVAVVMPMRGAK